MKCVGILLLTIGMIYVVDTLSVVTENTESIKELNAEKTEDELLGVDEHRYYGRLHYGGFGHRGYHRHGYYGNPFRVYFSHRHGGYYGG